MLVAITGLLCLAWGIYATTQNPPGFDWLILLLLTVLAGSRAAVRLPQNLGTISASDVFLFFSLLQYGIEPTVILAAAEGFFLSLRARHQKLTIVFNAAVTGLSLFCAGWLGRLLVSSNADLLHRNLESLVLWLALTAGTHYLINSGLIAISSALRDGTGCFQTWKDHYQWTALTCFAAAAAAGIIFRLSAIISVYDFLLVIPVVALLWRIYRYNLDKVEATQRHADEMAKLHLETIEALATAIDARHQTTHEHVRRVQIYAEGLARLFGLSEAEIQALHVGALLHDIGKLAVPDHVLHKPGKLTPGEFEKMKIHTVVGAEILSRVNFPYPVVSVVRSHHERWDGKGYPDALRGDQIPLTARILTVVDCFDAVREDRPYRCGLTREQAVGMLLDASETQFDPTVVNTFIAHLPQFEAEIAKVLAAEAVAQAQRKKIDWHDPAVRAKYLNGNTAAPSAGYATEAAAAQSPACLAQIRSAHNEGTALYELTRAISNLADPAHLTEVLYEQLRRLLPFDTCALFINHTAALSATAHCVVGRHADKIKNSRIVYGHGVTGFVLAQRRVFANTDPEPDLIELGVNLPESYQNVISCPLLRGEEMIGVLTLYSLSPEQYSLDHIRLLETVAAPLSDALHNALRHARSEEAVACDPLTGLLNARAMEIVFTQEVHRAERYGYPLTLLTLDIDGFRRFNDEHGHATGDRLLQEFARLLAAEFRAGDTFARFAGDRFVVLLHRLTPDLTDDLKMRLGTRLAEWRFETAPGRATNISVSMGHAVYEKDGCTLPELIEVATNHLRQSRPAAREQCKDNLRYFPSQRKVAASSN